MTAWIDMVPDEEAPPDLKEALGEARAPSGQVDNVMRVHSLRPSTMRGHVALYRAVLHDPANTLAPWLQETIGAYVSVLNDCPYSYANHWANATHLIGDPQRSVEIEAALRARQPERVFQGAELAMLAYAEGLTTRPGRMEQRDVEAMRRLGLDDGQVLEVNQIVCYFNYVNRVLNGLGVTAEGDVIGYYTDTGPAAGARPVGVSGTGAAR